MALLLQADVDRGAFSAEVAVVPNTIVSINANGSLAVYVENGTDGFVRAFTTEAKRLHGSAVDQLATSFVASSDTIKIFALHDDIHVTVYGD